MFSPPKLLVLFILALASCAEKPAIQHSYTYNNVAKSIHIEGQFIGLEEMDHFNAMEAQFIEHELVDGTRAKAKVLGSIEKIEGSTILLKSDSLNFFYAELEEPLLFGDSLLHRACILQGQAQMQDTTQLKEWLKPYANNKKRFLRFETRAAIILN